MRRSVQEGLAKLGCDNATPKQIAALAQKWGFTSRPLNEMIRQHGAGPGD